jgi:hypothetical protein
MERKEKKVNQLRIAITQIHVSLSNSLPEVDVTSTRNQNNAILKAKNENEFFFFL